jgi:hypothetical protein
MMREFEEPATAKVHRRAAWKLPGLFSAVFPLQVQAAKVRSFAGRGVVPEKWALKSG